LKRHNFLNIRDLSVDDARDYFASALNAMRYDIEKDFPDFDKNFNLAKKKVREANTPRKKMPVIKSADVMKFIKFIRSEGIKIKKEKVRAVNLIPMQNQMYLDNPIDAIRRYTLKGTLKFITSDSHSIVSFDNWIMDGNHRWLLAILYNPSMNVQVYSVALEHEELKNMMDDFTDGVTKRKRNEDFQF